MLKISVLAMCPTVGVSFGSSAATLPAPITSGHQSIVRVAEKCCAGWYRYGPDKQCHQFETSGGSNRGTTSACPPGMHIGQEGEYCWPNK